MEFDKATHTYMQDGEEYISVTTLLDKHGISPSYEFVDVETLGASAERGTLIHKEVEEYVKNGTSDCISAEAPQIIKYLDEFDTVESEKMVWYTDYKVAGTIDLVLEKDGVITLADIKTGVFHRDTVRWQLSLYAKCFEYLTGLTVQGLKCICFNDGIMRVVDIERIPSVEVEKLLIAEQNGEIYKVDTHENGVLIPDNIMAVATEFADQFLRLEEAKKQLEIKYNTVKEDLYNAMKELNITKAESLDGSITFTRVADTVKNSFDTKAFKADHIDLYEQYIKKSSVKGYVKISYSKE